MINSWHIGWLSARAIQCAIRRAVGGWRGRSLSFKHDGWNYTVRKPAYRGPADRNKKYLSVPGIRSTWLNSHKKVKVKVARRLRRSRAQPRRHRPAQAASLCLLTFFLSHAFFLPGAAKQHQPHSPTDAGLRERARPLCLTDKRRVRAANPAVESPPAASCGTFSAALHSRPPPANEEAGLRGEGARPANQRRGGGAAIETRQRENESGDNNYTELNQNEI